MFYTLTNTKKDHLLPPQTLHDSQLWAEHLWEEEGGSPISLKQKLMAGKKQVSIITVFLNKKGEDIGYWMIEEGEDKVAFFKTWKEIKQAIDNNKIKLI